MKFHQLLLALLLAHAAGTTAETLIVPIASPAERDAAGPLPENGTDSGAVRARWGEPATVHAAVGQPPIARWEYPGFDVYFEGDHVLHAVVRHQPPPPVVTEPPADAGDTSE